MAIRRSSSYRYLYSFSSSSRVKNPIDLHSIFSSCLSWFCALLNKYSIRSPSVLGITEFFRNSCLTWSVNPGLSCAARRNCLYKESTCFWSRLRTILSREHSKDSFVPLSTFLHSPPFWLFKKFSAGYVVYGHAIYLQFVRDSADSVNLHLVCSLQKHSRFQGLWDKSVSDMRPDEHKKKQRAEYKKKHGISNRKTASKEKQESSKDINPTDTREEEDTADTNEVFRLFRAVFKDWELSWFAVWNIL